MGLSILPKLLNKLQKATGRSWSQTIQLLVRFIRKLLANPQVAELWRFIFLGTVVETGRVISQKVSDWVSSFFVVRATFLSSDFAYDWVKHYLDSHHVWDESRSFKVVSRNTSSFPPHASKSELGAVDGHPDPVYEPAPQVPELFRWRGYWVSVNKSQEGMHHYTTAAEVGGVLHLRVWTRNRKVLDDLVLAARDFYINSAHPPIPRRLEPNEDKSGSLLAATFFQGDWSFDWMLSYLRSENALNDVTEFQVTTKQSDAAWASNGDDMKDTPAKQNAFPKSDLVRYLPAGDAKQMFLYTSPKTGKRVWIQVTLFNTTPDYRGRTHGGVIKVIVHTSHKPMLAEIVETAREQYMAGAGSRVVLHMTDNFGSWGKTMTKSRRPLPTLVLPDSVKENLLRDLREFLATEKWYVKAGVPHRRGYLLHGEPGTGKSSTIHAMAGELGLEIYCISLASPGIDDYNLAKLISDTPSRCILLLEDIDCAFPSRSEDSEHDLSDDPDMPDVLYDQNGKPLPKGWMPPKSQVTLSGLLNVLDSVSSEEGRITFATTNHIENLDPALIRAGRMDVKIQYKLATAKQAEQLFLRFYPYEAIETLAADVKPLGDGVTTAEKQEDDIEGNLFAELRLRLKNFNPKDLNRLANEFGERIPAETYSVAQIQGYLLRKKFDPLGAVEGLKEWFEEQAREKRFAEEKRKQRMERRKANMDIGVVPVIPVDAGSFEVVGKPLFKVEPAAAEIVEEQREEQENKADS